MDRAPRSPLRRRLAVAAASSAVTAALAAAALALVSAAPPAQRGPPPGPAGSFGEEHFWDDGKAEISQYAAEEIVEGEKRSFDAWSVVVAEIFDPDQMVKKEKFSLSYVPVLKCNWFLAIPTGVSRYQQMASLFLRRSDMLAMKVAFSSQEWCGMTFQEWRRDRPGFLVHSYWDGEADRTCDFESPGEDELFYEQVPLWARSRRPEHPRTEKITLIEKRLATSRCPPPKLVPAQMVFKGKLADGGDARIEVALVRGDATDTLVLADQLPYTLREWRRADGTTWKLKKSRRLAYWNFSANAAAGEWDKQ
jgi:hypothetical protein